jgi:hypothetical protein
MVGGISDYVILEAVKAAERAKKEAEAKAAKEAEAANVSGRANVDRILFFFQIAQADGSTVSITANCHFFNLQLDPVSFHTPYPTFSSTFPLKHLSLVRHTKIRHSSNPLPNPQPQHSVHSYTARCHPSSNPQCSSSRC